MRVPVAPARAFVPVLLAFVVGALLMNFRARYIESCWVAALRFLHPHCMVAYMAGRHFLWLLPYLFVAGCFGLLLVLALKPEP
jgi:hypothetical protein